MGSEVKLGELVPDDNDIERDAVHVALVPLVAGHRMSPGTRVMLSETGPLVALKSVLSSRDFGIVDPYLPNNVLPGETFWCFLLPGMVTGMRHHWKCDKIDLVLADATNQPVELKKDDHVGRLHPGVLDVDLDFGMRDAAPKVVEQPYTRCPEDEIPEHVWDLYHKILTALKDPPGKDTAAEDWLRSFAKTYEMDFEDLIDSSTDVTNRDRYLLVRNTDVHSPEDLDKGDFTAENFWARLADYLGIDLGPEVSDGLRWTCGC